MNASAVSTTSALEAGGRASHAAHIQAVLDALVRERQQLRRIGADAGALEANRLAICYWQARLSQLGASSLRNGR